jgi:hypothetical protein
MSYTLSFDEKVNGWTSFFSYIPERMVNLNNDFYTFKNGQLYIHEQDLSERNSFYGQPPAPTSVEVVMNSAPSEVKIFKTIELEGNNCNWDVEVQTNLMSGHILKESFEEKEDICYEYIKRNEEDILDTKLLSVQGIGALVDLDISPPTFNFSSVPSNINVGDTLYYQSTGDPVKVGVVTQLTSTSINVDNVLSSPSVGDFMFVAKPSVAESNGLKGYYASVKMVNEETGPIELFAVNSEISKSFP